jgi:hypothetical protein
MNSALFDLLRIRCPSALTNVSRASFTFEKERRLRIEHQSEEEHERVSEDVRMAHHAMSGMFQ